MPGPCGGGVAYAVAHKHCPDKDCRGPRCRARRPQRHTKA